MLMAYQLKHERAESDEIRCGAVRETQSPRTSTTRNAIY